MSSEVNQVTVVVGSQWGDEGKGKLVDLLCTEAGVEVVARCQGGNNAGHTVVVGDSHYAFHLLPSGIIDPKIVALLGNGVVIHVPDLLAEISENESKGMGTVTPDRLKISSRAHLVFDFHQDVDRLQEEKRKKVSLPPMLQASSISSNASAAGLMLGTTKKGIGPAYASKMNRSGLRVGDLVSRDFDRFFSDRFRQLAMDYMDQFSSADLKLNVDIDAELSRYRGLADKIRPYCVEAVSYLHDQLASGKQILVEGANASMLDIDFGTYPYVTSSNCCVGGVCTGLGIPPANIGPVYGVVKAYTTRVGAGVFPTEQLNEVGEHLQSVGKEFGVTTGRKRRCGWLDIPMLKYAHLINHFSALALTKLDILDQLDEIKIGVKYVKDGKPLTHFPATEQDYEGVGVEYITMSGWKSSISHCRSYEDLPENARKYVEQIESLLAVPISWIGVGQARDAIIRRSSPQPALK